MLRACGASLERDKLSQSRCWCRGLFCGKGGASLSKRLNRDLKRVVIARTRAEYEQIVSQADLFDDGTIGNTWLARLEDFQAARVKRSA